MTATMASVSVVHLVPLEGQLTILNLANTCFQVIQRQVADLILETVEIHLESAVEEIDRLMSWSPNLQEVVASFVTIILSCIT